MSDIKQAMFYVVWEMKYLQQKFDWFIYHRAYKSLERLSESSIGFVYLLELWLGYWREKYGIPDSLKSSTESFFKSQVETLEKKTELQTAKLHSGCVPLGLIKYVKYKRGKPPEHL